MRRFKRDFFSWVNQPPCMGCGGPTKYAGSGQPSQQEKEGMARNIELYVLNLSWLLISNRYRCDKCSLITRFARYNNPGKLLDTRKGRCGEWANVDCS